MTEAVEHRHCLRPDCDESFDLIAFLRSSEVSNGWHLVKMFATYICPAHAGPVTDGRHRPGWLYTGRFYGTRCTCGWMWQPRTAAPLGEHERRWAAHLVDVA